MNKFLLYGLLLLIYLGLSKSLSPNEFGIKYINSNKALSELIPGTTISVILTDIHSTGFIIKTYYHKYKIIYGFQSYEEVITRTSRGFMLKNKPFLGMSVFRRYKEKVHSIRNDNETENFTPLPPGSIFVGNKNFGSWIKKNQTTKVWQFFRVYRQIPKYLGWKTFTPNFQFYNKMIKHQSSKDPFHGENNEFGLNGSITRNSFPKYFERQKPNKIDLKSFLKDYFKENFIK